VQGIAYDAFGCTIYISAQHGLYAIAYTDGMTSAASGPAIANVRTGPVAPDSDGDIHTTTSVAIANGAVYLGVGSSCNACAEVDPTRATVQQLGLDGSNMRTRATRIRNPIALAMNPATGTLWAGGAGQDDLPLGHPYEFFDAVSLQPALADYGWPVCEENRNPYGSGADCSATAVPRIELPAYSTLIGAAFYPLAPTGAHAFAAPYRGGLFITAHGSWHMTGSAYYTPPRVAYVPMSGDAPLTAVDWSDPAAQWTELVGGFQLADGTTRLARPTGVTVGAQGSLFVADDQGGLIFRIRPK
jgi:glucose/arabinose dehydrogenase